MEYAYGWANRMSKAIRRKCGAIIYMDNAPVSCGINGTPPKESNECEYYDKEGNLVTKKNVIHAERNALYKMNRKGLSANNSSLFVTTAPCESCAEPVSMNLISTLYFTEMYRGVEGIEYLIKRGVSIKHINMKNEVITEIYQSDAEQNVEKKIEAILKIRKLFLNYNDGDFHSKNYDAIC
jgi:dCMP deaminase